MDGGDANDPRVPSGSAGNNGGVISAVPLDALAEFTIIASNATAEFGRSSGAVVNVVSKSGSNDLHWSAWEFFRNSVLNTRGFFDTPGTKSPFKQNQFGFRVGGKLLQDRTFYSVAYEGFRQRSNTAAQVAVPTAQFTNALTNPLIKGIFQNAYPSVSGSSFDPNNSNTWSTTLNRSLANNVDGDVGFIRLDQHISDRDQAFLTFSIADEVPAAAKNGGNLPGLGVGQTTRPYHVVLDDTHIFRSNLINDARIAFQRTPTAFPVEQQSAALLNAGGFRTAGPYAGSPYSANVASSNGFPTFTFQSGRFNTIGSASNQPQGRSENIMTYQDSLSWQHGKHQFKFGFQLARVYDNTTFSNAVRPSVTIADSSGTNQANFQAINNGTLQSQTEYYYLSGSSERGYRELEQGYFAQDSYRITPRLNLEYGLRYELFLPFSEVQNLISNAYVLDANSRPEPCTPLPEDSSLSNVAIINPAKYNIHVFCSDYTGFSPRLGFAWDAFGTGKTLLKGGYGIFRDRIFGNVYGNSRFNPPYTVATTKTTGNYDGSVSSSAIDTQNPYSLTTLDPALRNPYTHRFNLTVSQQIDRNTVLDVGYTGAVGIKLLSTTRPNFGTSFASAFRPSNQGTASRTQADIQNGIIRPPFADFTHRKSNAASNYNALLVSINRRFSSGFTFQGAYTLSHSHDNLSDDVAGSTDSATPPATIKNLLAPLMATGSSCVAAQGLPSNVQYLTAAVRCATGNTSLTTSQAATAFLQSYIQPALLGENYGDSSFDIRNRVAGSVIYELPFGKGKSFFSNGPKPVLGSISGWTVTSIVDGQSGTPFVPVAGTDANFDGDTNDRPVVIGPLSALGGSLRRSFTPSGPVVQVYNGCVGNAACPLGQGKGIINPGDRLHRGVLRQPGIVNWDFQTAKSTHLSDHTTLRFNADFFNILNHANFSTLQNSITSSLFGRALAQRSLGQTQSRQIQFGLKLEY